MKRSVIDRPMPDAAPVTRATLPSRRRGIGIVECRFMLEN
jgi:hypothetical protein